MTPAVIPSKLTSFVRTHLHEVSIFFGALIVSLTFIFTVSSFVQRQNRDPFADIVVSAKDSTEYIELARNMQAGRGFIRTSVPKPKPEIFRVPGYPLLLAGVEGVSKHPLSIPIAQAILFALSCVGIYLIGQRIGSKMIGCFAAVAYALLPSTHHLYLLALSETLFQCLLIAWIFILLDWSKVRVSFYRSSILLGGLSGLLVLVRSAAVFLLPFTLGIIGLHLLINQEQRTKQQLVYWIKKYLVALVVFCAITGAWVIRNERVAHFKGISTVGSYNIFFYNLIDFDMVRLGLTRHETLDQHLALIDATRGTAEKNNPEVIQRMGQFNAQYLRTHGLPYLQFHFKKMALFFLQSDAKSFYTFLHTTVLQRGEYLDPPLTQFFTSGDWTGLARGVFQNPRELAFLLERLGWALMFSLSLFSLFLSPKEQRLKRCILFSLALYFALITGPVLMSRYRLPTAPSLLLLSLLSLQGIWERYHAKKLAKTAIL